VINLPGLKILIHFVMDFTAVMSGPEKKITLYMHDNGWIRNNYIEELHSHYLVNAYLFQKSPQSW